MSQIIFDLNFYSNLKSKEIITNAIGVNSNIMILPSGSVIKRLTESDYIIILPPPSWIEQTATHQACSFDSGCEHYERLKQYVNKYLTVNYSSLHWELHYLDLDSTREFISALLMSLHFYWVACDESHNVSKDKAIILSQKLLIYAEKLFNTNTQIRQTLTKSRVSQLALNPKILDEIFMQIKNNPNITAKHIIFNLSQNYSFSKSETEQISKFITFVKERGVATIELCKKELLADLDKY